MRRARASRYEKTRKKALSRGRVRRPAARIWEALKARPVAVAVLAGVAARLLFLGAKSFWYDEAVTLVIAGQPDLGSVLKMEAGVLYGSPLFFAPFHAWLSLGKSEAIVRLFPCLGSVAALLISVRLVSLLLPAALLPAAAFLIALSPFSVAYAQEARMYSWLAAIQLACSLALFHALSRDRFGGPWRAYAGALAAGALVHAGIWVWWLGHVPALFLGRAGTWRRFAAASLPALLVSLGLTLSRSQPWAERLANPYRLPELWEYFRQGAVLFSSGHHAGGLAIAILPLLTLAVLGAGAAGVFARRIKPFPAVFLGSQALVPWLAVYACIALGLSAQLRYIVAAPVMLIALFLLAAGAWPAWLRGLLVAGLLGLQAQAFYRYHRVPPSLEPTFCLLSKKPLREAAALIGAGWRPGDRVLHVATTSYFPLRWMRPDLPQFHVAGTPELPTVMSLYGGPRPLSELLAGPGRIWLISCPFRFRDPPGLPAEYAAELGARCREPLRLEFEGFDVYLAEIR